MTPDEALMAWTVSECLFDGSEKSERMVKELMQILIHDPERFWDQLEQRTGEIALRQQIEDLLRSGQICSRTPISEVARLSGFAPPKPQPEGAD